MQNFSQNLKLKSKILFVIIIIIILLIAASFGSLLAIMHSENHLLFEADVYKRQSVKHIHRIVGMTGRH